MSHQTPPEHQALYEEWRGTWEERAERTAAGKISPSPLGDGTAQDFARAYLDLREAGNHLRDLANTPCPRPNCGSDHGMGAAIAAWDALGGADGVEKEGKS